MTKQIWINLPVKDIDKSKQFYSELGFKPNPRHPDSDEMASLLAGLFCRFRRKYVRTF